MDKSEQTQQEQLKQKENIVISPIQLLVNAVLVAYQRGAFTMKEAGLISQAVDYFTIETKQAVIPNIKDNQEETQNQTTQTSTSEKIIFQSQ